MTGAPLIVVSGPPGSGKTTVGGLLAERFARSAHVLGDHFFRYIRGDWKDPSLPEADQQNQVVIEVSAQTALGYSRAGYTTILDGIYGPWFLELVEQTVAGAELHYVVLRTDLATSIDRAMQRPETPASEAVIRAMHAQLAELGRYESHVVDTSVPTAMEVTKEVFRRLETGDFRLA